MDIDEAYLKVREHVGRTYREELGEIREIDIQRFAGAIGDEVVAAMDPHVAPPLYLSAVSGWDWGPPQSELRVDGTWAEQLAGVPTQGLRLMGGGQSLEFFEPVVAGTPMVEQTRVMDVRLKSGKTGKLLLIDVERIFISGGRPVVRCVERYIGR